MAVVWNEENAAHLYRRAGFGATQQQIKAAVKRGMTKTVESLFKFSKASDKLPEDIENLENLQAWWLDRMIRTTSPLHERLVLFWHNHFATGYAKIGKVSWMHMQNQTLRKGAAGSFRDLVTSIAKDPAMIYWLDNNTNTKKKPNQNFARELMELFTTGVLNKDGVANYNETDVNESAKAFTGWTVKDNAFFFNANNHDNTIKTFRGQSGNFDGTDIINMLVVDPATARRIPALLWSYFAYDIELTDPILDELAALYLANDTKIQPIVHRILTHDSFYSDASKRAGVKEPAVFFVSTVRYLRGKLQPRIKDKLDNGNTIGSKLQQIGQSLFDPPTVFGWDYGLSWVAASGMLDRYKVGQWFAAARAKDHPIQFKPQTILGAGFSKLDPSEAATRLLAAFGIFQPAPPTVAALATYLSTDDGGGSLEWKITPDYIDKKIRGAIALILGSSDFQAA